MNFSPQKFSFLKYVILERRLLKKEDSWRKLLYCDSEWESVSLSLKFYFLGVTGYKN